MSTGNESLSQGSGRRESSVSENLFSELEVVRSGGPLAVRPLNSVPPPQQTEDAAKRLGPVVPSIMADGESTHEEEVLRIKLGEIFAEPLRRRRHLSFEDEEEDEKEETEETGEKERTGRAEEEGEADEEGEVAEVDGGGQAGPSSSVVGKRRRKEKPLVLGAINIAMGGKVSYLASKMAVDDLAWIKATNAEGWTLSGGCQLTMRSPARMPAGGVLIRAHVHLGHEDQGGSEGKDEGIPFPSERP